jgi:hypothetical protein
VKTQHTKKFGLVHGRASIPRKRVRDIPIGSQDITHNVFGTRVRVTCLRTLFVQICHTETKHRPTFANWILFGTLFSARYNFFTLCIRLSLHAHVVTQHAHSQQDALENQFHFVWFQYNRKTPNCQLVSITYVHC